MRNHYMQLRKAGVGTGLEARVSPTEYPGGQVGEAYSCLLCHGRDLGEGRRG